MLADSKGTGEMFCTVNDVDTTVQCTEKRRAKSEVPKREGEWVRD